MSVKKKGTRLAVVGAGAWGTALANITASAGHQVVLWTRDPEHAARLRASRENTTYLPGVTLEESIAPTASLHEIATAEVVLVAVPAQSLRSVAEALSLVLHPGVPVISCAKGIERDTGFLSSDILAECLATNPPAALSGPSFAHDVARAMPTAVTLAAADAGLAAALAELLSTPHFRLYHTNDLRGVEIGGATKNVMAIATGIVRGRGLGESAAAALLTRGFSELARFGRACGARPETLAGLAGLGDLVLTCQSSQSRNFALGFALGRGKSPPMALAEGALTAPVLVEMAKARGVEMPIAEGVEAILSHRSAIDAVIGALLARPLRTES
jgi:glycerol-3-phosphate dehydrogenase (NAD(P)+)